MKEFLRFMGTPDDFTLLAVLFRVVLAAVVGAVIGAERSRTGHAAGLRTYILVAVGSAMTTLVGYYSVCVLGYSGDPLRMGAQVISGIGFLGAGQILSRNKTQVFGLTTAASLWVTASIGLAIGAGFYWASFAAVTVSKLTISLLPKLERKLRLKQPLIFYLETDTVDSAQKFVCFAESSGVDYETIPPKSGTSGAMGFRITLYPNMDRDAIVSKLKELPIISFLSQER